MPLLNLGKTQTNNGDSEFLYLTSSKRENCLLVGDHGFKLFAAQEVMAEQGVDAPEPPLHTGTGHSIIPQDAENGQREKKMRVFEAAG